MTPCPQTNEEWLLEIAKAYLDAVEAIPFGKIVGHQFGEPELFHLAPAISLKFRGLPRSKKRLKKVTDAALSSYVASFDPDETGAVLEPPETTFAFCYLASHFSLGLLQSDQVEAIMVYLEENRDKFLRAISTIRNFV